MRKIFTPAVIIVTLILGCKKENPSTQLIGTWTFYSQGLVESAQHVVVVSADKYPCMANEKFIFSNDGTYLVPKSTPCLIDIDGGQADFENNEDETNKWSMSGNTLYVTQTESTYHTTYIDTFKLVKTGSHWQLTRKIHNGGVATDQVWIKAH